MNELIEDLKPLGFDPNIALFLVYFYQLKNENQIFEYISTDGLGICKHPFLPKNEQDQLSTCVICDLSSLFHLVSPKKELLRAKSIYDIICNLNLQEIKVLNLEEIGLQSCQICYQLIPKNLMFFMNDVNHEICFECLNSYLLTEIKNNKVINMHCPHCIDSLDNEIIQENVDKEAFEKFLRFVDNNKVLSNKMLRFCPKCNQIIHLNNENDEKAACSNCKTEMCTKCNHPFHSNKTCEKVLEGEFKSWSNKKEVQRCPKCKVLIEKIEGCNHMTCYVCHYEFCWLCKGAYTSIHFFPLNPLGCPGLQSIKTKVHKWNWIKRFLIRILCFIVCIVLLPFASLLYLPICFCVLVFESRFYRRKVRNQGIAIKSLFMTLIILLCIILEPIFLVVEAIGVIPVILILLVQYFKERYRRSQKVIKISNFNI